MNVKTNLIFLLGMLFLLLSPCEGKEKNTIVFETNHVKYVLNSRGLVTGFIDKRTDQNYLSRMTPFSFLRLEKGGRAYGAYKLEQKDDLLIVHYYNSAAKKLVPLTLTLRVECKPDYLVFTVVSIEGDYYSIQFVRGNLTIDYDQPDSFAGSSLSLRNNIQTVSYPGRMKTLDTFIFQEIGGLDASVALIGVPEVQMRSVLKRLVQSFPKGTMPASTNGGAFALDSELNRRSYIMTSAGIRAEDVPIWAKHLHKLGASQIDFHTGKNTFRYGDMVFSPEFFPNGISDVRRMTDAFRAEGILCSMHTFSACIDIRSRFVTPVPHKDLHYMTAYTLSAPLSLKRTDKTVLVDESTEDVSLIVSQGIRNSRWVRIDDEIIAFQDVNRKAPYGFTKCVRGALGTKIAAHKKGTPVLHLTSSAHRLLPKPGSELFFEIARETARAYNEGGFNMLYLDGFERIGYTIDPVLMWYYQGLFVAEILKHVERPPIFECSSMTTPLWTARSRAAAWDAPFRGYQQFFANHAKSNKKFQDSYLPCNLGWLILSLPDRKFVTTSSQHLFKEDIDYLGMRAITNDFSLSWLSITEKPMKEGALRNAERIGVFEKLRLERYFSEEELKKVSDPQAHYRLQATNTDPPKWRFQKTDQQYSTFVYSPNETLRQNTFKLENMFRPQRPMIRIENRYSADPGSKDRIELRSFAEDQPAKKLQSIFYPEGKNLVKHPAFGLWVKGTGQKEMVALRASSPSERIGGVYEYYIDVNFTGWKYFLLIEPENGQRKILSPLGYPKELNDLREGPQFRFSLYRPGITGIHLFVPEGEKSNVHFRSLDALPIQETQMVNPKLKLNGKVISFRGTIASGHYMEMDPGGKAVVYNEWGETISTMTPLGSVPELAEGPIDGEFFCESNSDIPIRGRITIGTVE